MRAATELRTFCPTEQTFGQRRTSDKETMVGVRRVVSGPRFALRGAGARGGPKGSRHHRNGAVDQAAAQSASFGLQLLETPSGAGQFGLGPTVLLVEFGLQPGADLTGA